MDMLVLVALGICVLLWRSFFPAYTAEKGKNLATKEDIATITEEVERVKALYANKLKELEHQNTLLIEELRSRQQLRMAAIEKRLEVHQHAFLLWRTLISKVHNEDVDHLINECQNWWNRHCLFLSPEARDAFNRAYFAAAQHKALLQGRSDPKIVQDNWDRIMKAGELIVAGVELPPLGKREADDATRPDQATA